VPFDLGLARTRLELLWCEEALGVLGVVSDDVRTERHFPLGLFEALAHLVRHRASELVHSRAQNGGGFYGYDRSLRERCMSPAFKASHSGLNRLLKLRVGEFLERLEDFAVVGIDALIGHNCVLFQCRCAGAG
jgi:hypothetical protein